MACQVCLVAGAFVVIMLLCWVTRDSANKNRPAAVAEKSDHEAPVSKRTYDVVDSTANQVIKPPITGKVFGDYPALPETHYDTRKFMELPRGGLSCPNKRWYDSIYNGGVETILDDPDTGTCPDAPGVSRHDVESLWKEDGDVRRRETRAVRMAPQPPHGMMV